MSSGGEVFSRGRRERHFAIRRQPGRQSTGAAAGNEADRSLETAVHAHARGRNLLRRLPQTGGTIFRLEDQVRTLHDEVAGRVRVASIYSVGLHHMNRYLHEFLSQYPKANVRLEYLHPHRVYEAVENDQADLGLVSYPKASRTIKAIGWRQEPMVLVCSPTHRVCQSTNVSLEELAGEPIIGFDAELTIRREIDRVLARIPQRSERGDGVRQYRNDQAGGRNRRRSESAARADRGARSRNRDAGGGAAVDPRIGSPAGNYSSPRQRFGGDGAAVHRTVAQRKPNGRHRSAGQTALAMPCREPWPGSDGNEKQLRQWPRQWCRGNGCAIHMAVIPATGMTLAV